MTSEEIRELVGEGMRAINKARAARIIRELLTLELPRCEPLVCIDDYVFDLPDDPQPDHVVER